MSTPAPRELSILVADDDIEQRSLYVGILAEAGYRVLEAADGAQAVDVARRERPELVLMNIAMPITSGWNAVRALKEDPDTRPIPIILVTELANIWDRDASFASGCDEYLANPLPPVRLLEEVRKLISP
jgi:CheY-like chemotaxis protein